MKRLPSKPEIAQWLSEHEGRPAFHDISRAFGIKGAAKIDLKRMLAELEAEGLYEGRKKRRPRGEGLPPVGIIRVTGPDAQGDLLAEPADGEGDAPRILVIERKDQPALGAGDRVLAKLTQTEDGWHAHPIRKLQSGPRTVLGIYRAGSEFGRILPIDKGADLEFRVAAADARGAKDGELVEAEQTSPPRLGLPKARIVRRLGDPGAPRAVSLIAIHQHGIPDHFPDSVLAEADSAPADPGGKREDLRGLPLLTIDPSDARDHDDAVCAEPGADGGFVVWVAIADVAAYVRPGSELDREARKRGNSSYFPDRVVPMLPDRLSGDLCSLHEGVDRPVLAVRMEVSAQGEKTGHRFVRGMMNSRASLTYEQAQAAFEGRLDSQTDPLAEGLSHLYAAWQATLTARAARQPLDLDLPERRIVLDEDGTVTSVAFKDRLDAHKVIEEFMVMANVAAAEELIARRSPLLFRVHEEPTIEKIEALREVAQGAGLVLAKGQVLQTRHLNKLLADAEGSEFDELINMATLRSMTQAYYAPENFGHFGLALRNYAHFTSPIRRYSDLIVHRALIAAHKWGKDGLSDWDTEHLAETATQISETERRSMAAERDTSDRYLAAFMADRIGAVFRGRISGVARFGLFVKLDETGADGLVPIRSLGDEYFHHDADSQTLRGEKTGTVLGLGQRVEVKLAEAEAMTGGLLLELLEVEGAPMARARRGKGRGKGPVSRKGAAAKAGRIRRRRER
ncbi:ribonuclease R [Pararhodobacter aggregans]|uniref:Ribonuclease R n=1 Tax=Pararhodobacter aggregans TaxID=404875 RepID=A0A2T7UXS1_9RHOB|nr:ribonuclease R [Pararhodobacter aggregans]PTX05060.1 RNAse R [Pararhodobacter aggregans]PVE49371.1 ribonuclease R [Pararhodobacter aggregans]